MESASSRRFGYTSPVRVSSSSKNASSGAYSSRRSPARSPSPSTSPKFSPVSPPHPNDGGVLMKRYSLPAFSSRIARASTRSSPPESVHSYPPGASKNENITVTVRFRPLSIREIQRGDQVGWYAEGSDVIRMESNAEVAYAFDRVFGPATTTRAVYDMAAQPVVCAAMEGVNGTVFAYGVTSSGKTHTMHGDNKSPGVIPLAVKEVFSIIQETPGREFLLRVSYLEIYNEVINDLLNPAAQNLKIREDAQVGTYVEGLKQEVVLSPAHALSLIAAGEEHRHVGATNYNAISSRSHTIFTLTIESTGRDKNGYEEVALSQLHLIDLAGSESSKTNTTGLRRKEGSFINKSLLTLGTVISKLSEGKPGHVPFRDSKLTRLLQPSLSGNGKISLICTVTPASGTSEETHNTIKFAHRAKCVEVRAEHNRILDEKSLIKKYQKEISELRTELSRLKKERPISAPEDLMQLREKLEADQMFMQSRLEEEEQSKAALLGRIQRLTKLILVSTKTTVSSDSLSDKLTHRRRLSFGEEDLAYLKHRRIDWGMDDDDDNSNSIASEDSSNLADDKDEKKNKRRGGMLGWLKLKSSGKTSSIFPPDENGTNLTEKYPSRSFWTSPGRSVDSFSSRSRSRSKSKSRKPTPPGSPMHPPFNYQNHSPNQAKVEPLPLRNQAGELFSTTGPHFPLPSTGESIYDQMELLKEQIKVLSAELGLQKSNLKRVSEQDSTPELEEEIGALNTGIEEKIHQIRTLENKIKELEEIQNEEIQNDENQFELSKTVGKLKAVLSEKTFEMEITNADNRILQDTLQAKTKQNEKLLEEINLLRVELTRAIAGNHAHPLSPTKATDDRFMLSPSHSSLSLSSFSSNLKSDALLSNVENGEESRENGFVTPVKGEEEKEDDGSLMQIAEIEDLKMQIRMLLEERELMSQQQKKLANDLAEAKTAAIMQPMGEGNTFISSSYLTLPTTFPESSQILKRVEDLEEKEKKWKQVLEEKENLVEELKKANFEIERLRNETREKEILFEIEKDRLQSLSEPLKGDALLREQEKRQEEGSTEKSQNEISSLSNELSSLKKKVQVLEETLMEKEQNHSLLQIELTNSSEEKERLESFYIIALEEKDTLLLEASQRESALKAEISELKKQWEKEKEEHSSQERMNDFKEAEIADMVEKISRLTSEKAESTKLALEAMEKSKLLEIKLNESEALLQAERSQLDIANAHRSNAEEVISELRSQLEEERRAFRNMEKEREEDSARSFLDEEVIEELKKRHAEDVKRMTSELLQVRYEYENLQRSKSKVDERVQDREEELERIKNNDSENRERIRILEEELQRITETKEKEISAMSLEISKIKQELEYSKKAAEIQSTPRGGRVEITREEMEAKNALLEKLEKEKFELSSKLAEALASSPPGVDPSKEDLVRQIKAQESAINALSGREEELREELACKDGELASTKEELSNARQRESGLENDLATMWVLVAELRRQSLTFKENAQSESTASSAVTRKGGKQMGAEDMDSETKDALNRRSSLEAMDSENAFILNATKTQLARERQRCLRLEEEIARLKGDDLNGLDFLTLQELISTHEDALAKIALFKVEEEQKLQDDLGEEMAVREGIRAHLMEFKVSKMCKGCFERDVEVQLTPCHHPFCKDCATTNYICPQCLNLVQGFTDLTIGRIAD